MSTQKNDEEPDVSTPAKPKTINPSDVIKTNRSMAGNPGLIPGRPSMPQAQPKDDHVTRFSRNTSKSEPTAKIDNPGNGTPSRDQLLLGPDSSGQFLGGKRIDMTKLPPMDSR